MVMCFRRGMHWDEIGRSEEMTEGCRHGVFEEHECPYSSEVAGDYRLCSCCEECTAKCADDI